MRIKIAIADDHTLFRRGIIKLLDTDRYEVLYDVSNGQELINRLEQEKDNLPHIVIMDMAMPVMNGYITAGWIKENCLDVRVLVVSMIEHEDAIMRMLHLNVKGYLSKTIEPEDLHNALQSVASNRYYYTDIVTNKFVHEVQASVQVLAESGSNPEMSLLWRRLNQRQKEFVLYACTEMRYEDIANKMYVSPKTVDGYRDKVFEKFDVKSRVGLVLFAIKNGLVSL